MSALSDKAASATSKAVAAWGRDMPYWVRALAEACDASGLRVTAAKMEVSPASISLAIRRERANLDWIRGKVERRLMVSIVACPVLGVVGKADCLREQSATCGASPMQAWLYRACRNGCPHFRGEKQDQAALAATKPAARRGKSKEAKV